MITAYSVISRDCANLQVTPCKACHLNSELENMILTKGGTRTLTPYLSLFDDLVTKCDLNNERQKTKEGWKRAVKAKINKLSVETLNGQISKSKLKTFTL